MENKTERSVCIRRIGSAKVQPPEGNNIYYSFLHSDASVSHNNNYKSRFIFLFNYIQILFLKNIPLLLKGYFVFMRALFQN